MGVKSFWYRGGLRFDCRSCGGCCGGGPGYVWVTQVEIENLAKRFGISSELFEKVFVWTVRDGRRSLKEYPNGDCVLLDDKTRKCKFYEERPTQCKTWPFWSQNILNKKIWDEVSEICPGCNCGRLYSVEEIEERRLAVKL
jgi:Fe-S-cluster containining protein